MEKLTDRSNFESRRRLLIFFFLIVIFSKNLFAVGPYENLKFAVADNQLFMTGSEIEFSLVVPSASSKNVSLKLPELEKGSSCTSIKKNDFIDDNGKKSTLIEFTLLFQEKGIYNLKSALLTVSRRSYSVNFDSFEIKENPYKLIPKLIVVINDSNGKNVQHMEFTNSEVDLKNLVLKKNETYDFSVYVQNISTVDNFVWDIPHNSIFSIKNNWEESAIEINKKTARLGNNRKITYEDLYQDFEKIFKLADFQWTLLSLKENEFPRLKFAYHSFSDHKNIIESKNVNIKIDGNFSKLKIGNPDEKIDDGFANAFTIDDESNHEILELSYEECVALMQKEKKNLNIFNKLLHKNYGIIFKTDLYSIPEETASRVMHIKSGTKVEVSEQTTNWYFVTSDDEEKKSGWCKKENVLLIR